jgi:hypothetical protein
VARAGSPNRSAGSKRVDVGQRVEEPAVEHLVAAEEEAVRGLEGILVDAGRVLLLEHPDGRVRVRRRLARH